MTITFTDIQLAHNRIHPFIHRTPIMHSRLINEIVGGELFFKCENFQKGGAFKARGAFNAIYSMSEDRMRNGIVTHSSGNHAAAVALASRSRNIPAHVVMPYSAIKSKKAAVVGYGATVVECDPDFAAREKETKSLLHKTGGVFVHPFNDDHIIAGQGTTAIELIEDVSNLDMLLCPIGGGALMAGAAIAASHMLPRCKIIGCEPSGADDARQSLDAGYIIPNTHPTTIADGLKATLGDKIFPHLQAHVHAVWTVSDEAIILAMRMIWQYMKIIIEPSSAVVLAAILTHKPDLKNKRVGLILTGGNVDLEHFLKLNIQPG